MNALCFNDFLRLHIILLVAQDAGSDWDQERIVFWRFHATSCAFMFTPQWHRRWAHAGSAWARFHALRARSR